MKILILGKGYIGNYLAAGNKVDEVHHLGKSDIDYSKPENLMSYLHRMQKYPKTKFDWIVNCSGYTGKPNVEACETNQAECYHYNVTIPLYITRVANTFQIPIIHIGSGCIYDGYAKVFDENDPPNFGASSYTSSFYSKTKDTFEKLSAEYERIIFRIRIPFNGKAEPKNYLWKLLNYDNLITQQNSITNVDDLVEFTYDFMLTQRTNRNGIFNVVNEDTISAKEIVPMLREHGLNNPNWKFVSLANANFKVGRSNCALSNSKLHRLGLVLPNVRDSLKKAIDEYTMTNGGSQNL